MKQNHPESVLLDLDECTLHRRTPYGIAHVTDTQFSIARFYGAITFNGEHYTYFPATDELIRDDVLEWKTRNSKQNANHE